jgi:methyl-accepting chemotaxis protein
MMPRSIKTRLVLGLVSVIAIILAGIMVIVAFSFSSQSREAFLRAAKGEMSQLDYAITLFLDESMKNADMLAKAPAMQQLGEVTTNHLSTTEKSSAKVAEGDAAGRRIVDFFAAVQASHPAYVEVFLGNERGSFVSSLESSAMPAGYDPRKRPWYSEAKPVVDKATLSKAYMSTTGEAVTSAARTVLRNGTVVGVVGIDISLKNLTELVKSVKLGESGYVALVQDDGVVLADPRHDAFNFKKVGEIESKHLDALFKMEAGSQEFEIDGKKYLGIVYTSPKTKWKLMGFMELSEINAPVKSTLYLLGFVGIVSLAVMALAIWLVSNNFILKPLSAVSSFVAGIAKGVYDHRIGTSARTRSAPSTMPSTPPRACLNRTSRTFRPRPWRRRKRPAPPNWPRPTPMRPGATPSTPRARECLPRRASWRPSWASCPRRPRSFPHRSANPAAGRSARPCASPRPPPPWRR